MPIYKGTIDDDTINGSPNTDLIYGYDPDNQAATDGGNDTLNGFGGSDSLYGGKGADTLQGGDGNDILNGGPSEDIYVSDESAPDGSAYRDLLIGGDGDDTYYVTRTIVRGDFGYIDYFDEVVEYANQGVDTVITDETSVAGTGQNIENLIARYAIRIGGNALDNVLTGNSNRNEFYGGGGRDTFIGGQGNDAYYVDGDDTVIDDGTDNVNDSVYSSASYVMPESIERLYLTAPGLTGRGNQLANMITGSEGGDTLYGMGGDDRLFGGGGDDVLDGGDGYDLLNGGDGFDTVDYSAAQQAVTYVTAQDLYVGIELIIGSDYGDTFRAVSNGGNEVTIRAGGGEDTLLGGAADNVVFDGGADNDSLKGGVGAETFIGGAGDDSIDGGGGVDTLDFSDMSVSIHVDLSVIGQQTIGTGLGRDTIVKVENIVGGRVADFLSGDGGVNRIDGGGGNDTLAGGGGNDVISDGDSRDTVDGGDGDDVLISGRGDDILKGGAGVDTADYSRFDGRVTVNLSATTAQATGQSGSDTLSGIENLRSGIGSDRLVGSTGANDIKGGANNDVIAGLGGSDTLSGEAGNDQLIGGNGNDVLIGGAGRDELVGGGDADTFVYQLFADSVVGTGRDTINDFQLGLDVIDLRLLDADAIVADDQAFTFIGTDPFSHNQGQLRAYSSGALTLVEGDIDGDNIADFQIALKGTLTLSSGDFLL